MNTSMKPPAIAGSRMRLSLAVVAVVVLAGCASLSPDGGVSDVQTLVAGKTGGVDARLPGTGGQADADTVAELLKAPLSAESAVRIALLNNAGLRGSIATLGVSDALRVQAGTLPNPHFAIGRFRQGDEVEIERLLSFNLVGLMTLPWKYQWQTRQHELAIGRAHV